ncbi:hypothetical protein Hanom_Chr13g01194081 [Helianthus anomalus]
MVTLAAALRGIGYEFEVAKPAVKEENVEDSIILPTALHANEDHKFSFCSDSGNPKQRMKADCEKEIDEVVAQIRLKYEAKHQEADAAYNSKKMELVTNIHRVHMTKDWLTLSGRSVKILLLMCIQVYLHLKKGFVYCFCFLHFNEI